MRINIGRAASDHELSESYSEPASRSPAFWNSDMVGGRWCSYNIIPAIPVSISDAPIQIELSRNINMITISTTDKISGSAIIENLSK